MAVAIVLALSLRAGMRSTADLVAERAAAVVDSVAKRIAEHLDPARAQTAYVADLIERAAVDVEDPDALQAVLGASLAAAPQLSGTIFSRVDGSGIVARRGAGGNVESFAYGPGARAYRGLTEVAEAAEQAGIRDGRWGEIAPGRGKGDAVVNYLQPAWRGAQFAGVLGAGVRTSELATYLEGIARPTGAVAFVLLGTDELVAASGVDMRALARESTEALARISNAPDAVLRALLEPLDPEINRNLPSVPGFEVQIRDVAGDRFVVVFQHVDGLGPTPWIVGCYFESERIDDAFERLRTAAVAGAAVLLVAVLVTFFAGRRLGRPVIRLARAAQSVRRDGLAAATALPDSGLLEIDAASQAFNEMIDGLRDRERMRETFGRYVPESVADALIADDGVLRPQTRICTTLFTDIVGFSTISERLSPQELIGMLNEYFAAVIGPIERHGGVIHQFQGDAVLATYNLPVARDDHAAEAIRSALEIQEATRGRTFGPGAVLETRIGINSGLAVCGTVGSASRLGFTVHGDDVNLAARIEEMNKAFGTRILVAESTVELAGEGFDFERVDSVAVRGRQRTVAVYRVAGPHSDDESR